MTELLIRYQELGGHIHCEVFSRTLPTETWAKNGNLVFDKKEWPEIEQRLLWKGVTRLERIRL